MAALGQVHDGQHQDESAGQLQARRKAHGFFLVSAKTLPLYQATGDPFAVL